MMLRLSSWFRRPPQVDNPLYRPPRDVATRRDTIDELIEADAENVSTSQRVILGLATSALLVSTAVRGQNILGGSQTQHISQVWGGQDTFEKTATDAPSAQSEKDKATQK